MSTLTAAAVGSINRSAARWSDLPDELLGMVILRVTSQHDRVRSAAVCKSWRAAALHQPAPPATPLLLLLPWAGGKWKKHLCGPNDSSIFRVPPKVAKKWLLGAHDGGWVAATDFNELTVVNLFSGVEVPLSPKQRTIFSRRYPCPTMEERKNNLQKIIFSQDPTSSNGCILAGIKEDRSHIMLCRVGCVKGEMSTYQWHGEKISDIAFCNGELYVLTDPNESLIKFEIGMKEDGTTMITETHQFMIQSPSRANNPPSQARYIFELHGKPSMAVMTSWLPNCDPFFRVFKLIGTGANEVCEYKWAEMTSFGDYALFLGRKCSKAVHVPVGARRHGVERNHIYYSTMYAPWYKGYKPPLGDEVYSVVSDLHNGKYSDMYCKEDQNVEDGVGRIGYYVGTWYDEIWLLPPDL